MLRGSVRKWDGGTLTVTFNKSANAPRLWIQEVIRQLKDAGFQATTLDRMLFEHRDTAGELSCLALVYVDGFVVTCRHDFGFSKLETIFSWGGTRRGGWQMLTLCAGRSRHQACVCAAGSARVASESAKSRAAERIPFEAGLPGERRCKALLACSFGSATISLYRRALDQVALRSTARGSLFVEQWRFLDAYIGYKPEGGSRDLEIAYREPLKGNSWQMQVFDALCTRQGRVHYKACTRLPAQSQATGLHSAFRWSSFPTARQGTTCAILDDEL